jgi:uncharacterized protein (TIGR04141 family)
VTQLSCYSLPDAEELEDVLDEALRDDASIQMLGPVRLAGCDVALFVQLPAPREPSWARRLRQSFPDLPNLVGGGSGAVLAVKLDDAAGLLALTFGTGGRFMLDPSAWERGFGTKTALNIIFQGDDGTLDDYASRIQSIDSTRLESARLQIRQQASNTSPFELFGVDILRDVLRGLVGTPWDIEVWRGRIGGGDALRLGFTPNLDELATLAPLIVERSQGEDYRSRFSWIDHIRQVRDPAKRAELTEQVLEELQADEVTNYELAIPVVVDWNRVHRFQFDKDKARRGREAVLRPRLSLNDFLGTLPDDTPLTQELLRRKRLTVLDGDGDVYERWPIWQCLTGELKEGGQSFVIDNGAFYEVELAYEQEVTAAIDALQEWPRALPAIATGISETDYNRDTAAADADLLLMDRDLIKTPQRSSRVELCDFYCRDGAFVHVKKNTGAVSMSHLFSQSVVAADLLVSLPAFREDALTKLQAAADQKLADEGGVHLLAGLTSLTAGSIDTRQHPVVLAIMSEKWDGRALAEGLSFFSKVNLRRATDDIERLRFPVRFRRVQMVAAP